MSRQKRAQLPPRFIPTGPGQFKQRTMTAGELVEALQRVDEDALVSVAVQNFGKGMIREVLRSSVNDDVQLWVDCSK